MRSPSTSKRPENSSSPGSTSSAISLAKSGTLSLKVILPSGLSLEAIGQLTGRHPTTVGYWVKQHGLSAVHRDRHAPKGGIDRETAVEAMLNSVIASPMIKYRGPFVLDQPDEAWFDCNLMQKDMLLALEAGREFGVSMPTTATSNELLSAARGMGLDHYDFAIVFDVLAAMAGVKGSVA